MARFSLLGYYIIKCHSECVSTNQRPGRPSSFSNQPDSDLGYCKVSLNSVLQFRKRIQKCLSQSEAGVAIFLFRSARKTQTWWRTLRSCFLSSFVEFRLAILEKKSKMRKLTTYGKRMDGRRTTRDHNGAVEPSAQVHLKE